MEEIKVLENIPFDLKVARLAKRLRVPIEGGFHDDFTGLCRQAQALGRPRGTFRAVYVAEKGPDWVRVGPRRFVSRVLRTHLESTHRVFPFAVTCGAEMDRWAGTVTELLPRYWTEAIREEAMRAALAAVKQAIQARYRPGRTAVMTPGSIDDWPTAQQGPLLDLLEKGLKRIGISRTDAMMMVPVHSLAGIVFPTDVPFESCMLCPRRHCPGRRAPHDPALARHMGANEKRH